MEKDELKDTQGGLCMVANNKTSSTAGRRCTTARVLRRRRISHNTDHPSPESSHKLFVAGLSHADMWSSLPLIAPADVVLVYMVRSFLFF